MVYDELCDYWDCPISLCTASSSDFGTAVNVEFQPLLSRKPNTVFLSCGKSRYMVARKTRTMTTWSDTVIFRLLKVEWLCRLSYFMMN